MNPLLTGIYSIRKIRFQEDEKEMNENNQFLGFIGTYTKKDSKGIYSFVLSTKAKRIDMVSLAAKVESPTYLAISRNNRNLYSVAKENYRGGVAAFTLHSASGQLTEINKELSSGSPPCHVSINKSGNQLFSANYHKGTATLYRVNENGSLNPPSFTAEHHGSGPDARQEKAHTHFAGYDPKEKYICVVDLGSDYLFTYEISAGELKEKSRFKAAAGSGPRHLAFHPNGKYAYIITEFSSEVIALAYNQTSGSFTELQYISTIGPYARENNQGSAIHLSSDGRFLYAGNRGENTIAIFAIDSRSGKLELIDRTGTEGNWPRDFSLDPSEQFLIVANQESNNIVLFERNRKTGKLSLLQSDVTVSSPVCIKFLHY